MKTELIDILDTAERVHREFIEALPADERNSAGTWEKWSGKTNLAHIVFWMQWRNQQLTAMLNNDESAWPAFDENHDYNRSTFDANVERSWDAVYAEWQAALPTMRSLIGQLSEAQLAEPLHFATMNGTKMWPRIVGITLGHPLLHMAGYYLERGDSQHALQMQQLEFDTLADFGDGSHRAASTYDLACMYARTGNAERALALLPEAFALDAALREWALKDTDLDSLRTLPEFMAMTAVPQG
jgi:tetratricopeptide (TPR) repeat protein